MAGGASGVGARRPPSMRRVLESHIKALQAWESFDRARAGVRVTDRADGAV
jgi:hypothetical protein